MNTIPPLPSPPAFQLDGLNIAATLLERAIGHADRQKWGNALDFVLAIEHLLTEARSELEALLNGNPEPVS